MDWLTKKLRNLAPNAHIHRVVYGFGSALDGDEYICVDCGKRFSWRPALSTILPDTVKNVVLANFAEGRRLRDKHGYSTRSLAEMYELFGLAMPLVGATTPDLKHPGE